MGEEQANRVMFKVTEFAVKLLEGIEIETPIDFITRSFDEIYHYASEITCEPNLRQTFVLNALVPIDFALWQLWYNENEKSSFDDIYSFDGVRQSALLNVPLVTYNTSVESVRAFSLGGASLLKIKIGSDPLKNNDLDAMLEWDKKRLLDIHRAVSDIEVENTESGRVMYYLDANGRYDSKKRLKDLIEYAEKHGILERIVLLEEPFDEKNKTDVLDISVTVAADERAHSVSDVEECIRLGYRALALKPIAKTLSMTLLMHKSACIGKISSFCADLTVNPVMVAWNRCVASRLNRIDGMRVGIVESNGAQNYANWEQMTSYRRERCEYRNGAFYLGGRFYSESDGVFEIPLHYSALTESKS